MSWFHSFAADGGVRLLDSPTDLLTPVPLADVRGHNLIANERRRANIDTHISEYFWHRRMQVGFRIRTLMAELDRPSLGRSLIEVRGRFVLNGAAGDRARNRLMHEIPDAAALDAVYRETFGNPVAPPPAARPTAAVTWIASKNFFNFFHFLTESFHMVAAVARDGAPRQVQLVAHSDRVEPFTTRWAEDLRGILPEGSTLDIVAAPPRPQGRVAMPFSGKHLLYQFTGPHWDMIERARPADRSWTGFGTAPPPLKVLALNAYDESLGMFRDQAIALARARVPGRWSDRIIVVRSPDLQRRRIMRGEDALVEELSAKGFEKVHFEHLSPLEQIRCVSDARSIVMQHGAGMANIIFARPEAHVFELGTYQTALRRWGDFIPLSHVAGCHYHHVFLDMDFPHEDRDPVFAQDGLVAPVIPDANVARLARLIARESRDRRRGAVSGLVAHSDHYIARRAFTQAYRLLDNSAPLFPDCAEYWHQRARVDEATGHRNAAARNYYNAYGIAPTEELRQSFLRTAWPHDPRRVELAG